MFQCRFSNMAQWSYLSKILMRIMLWRRKIHTILRKTYITMKMFLFSHLKFGIEVLISLRGNYRPNRQQLNTKRDTNIFLRKRRTPMNK